jgi:acyl-homoserine-lactone acylase
LIDGVGYTPIFAGSSYIQAVSWKGGPSPDARALVTYSQSTDPDSPHFSDLTHLFSQEVWVELPFKPGQILQDPELETLELMEAR